MDAPNGKSTPIEMQMMLDEVQKTIPFQIKLQTEIAKVMFARYQALITAGFNAEQALEIIKARGAEN